MILITLTLFQDINFFPCTYIPLLNFKVFSKQIIAEKTNPILNSINFFCLVERITFKIAILKRISF